MKKPILLVPSLLILVLLAGCAKTNPAAAPPSAGKANTPTTADGGAKPDASVDLSDQETTSFVLNFYSKEVVFTGYPYVNKAAVPRLYNLTYIDTIVDDENAFPEKLTDPAGNWAPQTSAAGTWSGMFEASHMQPKIYIPIGRSAANAPVWQTMEIIKKSDVLPQLGTCTETPYTFLGSFAGTSYSCQNTPETKEFAASQPCYIPLDDTSGILYKQYARDGSATGSMCDVIKNNFIASVALQS